MRKKQIAFVTDARYPSGGPASNRFENLGLILKRMGYEVTYIGIGGTSYKQIINGPFGNYVSLRKYSNKNLLAKTFSHIGLENRVLKYANEKFSDATALIVSGFSPSFLQRLVSSFADRNCKIILSVMEEFTKFELQDGKTNPYLLNKMVKRSNYLVNEFTSDKVSILTISSYLENKFKSRNMSAVRVPFVFDKDYKTDIVHKAHDKLRFIYCGGPANKDDLPMMIEGFSLLSPDILKQVQFDIIGVDKKWFINRDKANSIYPKIKESIIFHGPKPRDYVYEMYSLADFSVLMRDPDQVFTKAGFPTKVSESLYLGVPVISNITSDLGMYLEDSKNSMIVPKYSAVSLKETIERTLPLNSGKLKSMKHDAKETSTTKLSTDAFWPELKSLIES